MAYWKCPSCGFEAQNDKQKQDHMTRTASDPKHAQPSTGMGMGGQPSWGTKSPAPSMPPQRPMPPQQQGGKGPQKPQ